MDIEDWYHLDYFDKTQCDKNYSMLDGINVYRELLSINEIKSSFFILGELAKPLKTIIRELSQEKHDIGSHGWDHLRPLKMTLPQFSNDLLKSKNIIENIIGTQVEGYRAPCFSMNRSRLDLVKKTGFKYDSSRIAFKGHPIYGQINIDGYEVISNNIFKDEDFFEFQISTQKILGKNIPVSGGGYLRLFPWLFMGRLIDYYLTYNELFVFYIHPFEFSTKPPPPFPASTIGYNKTRFSLGRSTVQRKFAELISLLKSKGFRFTTFSALRNELLEKKTVYAE